MRRASSKWNLMAVVTSALLVPMLILSTLASGTLLPLTVKNWLYALPNIRPYKHGSQEIAASMELYESSEFNYPYVGFLCGNGTRMDYNSPPQELYSRSINNSGSATEPLIDQRRNLSIDGLPGKYVIKRIMVAVGVGKRDFDKATKHMLRFDVTNSLQWVRMVTAAGTRLENQHQHQHQQHGSSSLLSDDDNIVSPGSTVATLSRFYNSFLWSLNPCRVISVEQSRKYVCRPFNGCAASVAAAGSSTGSSSSSSSSGSDSSATTSDRIDNRSSCGLYSEVVYSTLLGHLIAGEEAFRVYWDSASERVDFEVVSYSAGCGILGKLVMPLVRPLQRKFLLGHAEAMLRLMQQD